MPINIYGKTNLLYYFMKINELNDSFLFSCHTTPFFMEKKMTAAEQSTHTTITVDANADNVNRPLPQSIRSIIRGDILAGVATSETRKKIETLHPTTAACKKFSKHYAWYKGQIKKEEKNGASLPLVSK